MTHLLARIKLRRKIRIYILGIIAFFVKKMLKEIVLVVRPLDNFAYIAVAKDAPPWGSLRGTASFPSRGLRSEAKP
jgi:hypothetical protein